MKRCLSYWFTLLTVFIFHSAYGQWIESNNGIYGGTITSLASINGHVFAGTWGGVYHSTNNGIGWEQMNDGLDNTFINAMAVNSNGKVFVATQGGGRMFVSSAPFANWTMANVGLPANPLMELAVINNQIFGITSEGLLYTVLDGGTTSWTQIDTNLGPINSISCSTENLFAATDNGIYLSTDRGISWISKNNGLLDKSIYSVSTVNRFVIARARVGITFFSRDYGSNWSLVSIIGGGFKLVEYNNVLYATNELEAYYTVDQGKNWEAVRGLPGARDMTVNGSTLVAGNPYGIYISANGAAFTASNFSRLTNARIVGLASSQEHLFTATRRGDVFRSSDFGKNWTSISKGLPFSENTAIGYFDNVLLIAKSDYGLYRSENDGESWERAGSITRISSFVKHKNQLFAGTKSGVYISSDKGYTWVRLNNSLQSQSLHLFDKQDTLFATSPDYGVSYSTDTGQTWTFINDGLPLPVAQPTSMAAFQELTLLGAKNLPPIYIRENISSSWQATSEGLSTATITTSFATDGRIVFAAGDQGVFSSNTGFDWSSFYNDQLPIFSSPLGVETLMVYRNHLVAGTEAHGVWISCIQPPRPGITIVGNSPNDSTLISDSPEGNQWFLNGTPISGANQRTFTPVISGKYAVKIILNDCESEISDEVNLIVREYPDALIRMPNVFTPNGDAYNPEFLPKQYDNVSNAELRVIDRWGQEIFHTDDLSVGWNGVNSQAGVYYYEVSYIGKNGKQGRIHGWVHLIR